MRRAKIILTLMLTIIIAANLSITTAFSWLDRLELTGSSLTFEKTVMMRPQFGTQLSISSNRAGVQSENILTVYDSTDIRFSSETGLGTLTGTYLSDNMIKFRTEITNSGSAPQKFSLYFSNIKNTSGKDAYIGMYDNTMMNPSDISAPSKSFNKIPSDAADFSLLKNMYVGANSTFIVEWYFYAEDVSAFNNIFIKGLYIYNN